MLRLLMIVSADGGKIAVVNWVSGVAATIVAARDADRIVVVAVTVAAGADGSGDAIVVGTGSRLNRLAITWAGGTAIGMW